MRIEQKGRKSDPSITSGVNRLIKLSGFWKEIQQIFGKPCLSDYQRMSPKRVEIGANPVDWVR